MTSLTALEVQMLTAMSFNYCFQHGGFEIWSSQLDEMSDKHLLPEAAQRGAIIASLKNKGLVKVSMSGTRDSVISIPEETTVIMAQLRANFQG